MPLTQKRFADLQSITALTPANDDVLQRKGGAWTNRSPAQLAADLSIGASPLPYNVAIPGTVAPNASSAATTIASVPAATYGATIQAGPAINNYMEWTVAVAAGTYTLAVWYAKGINEGITTVSIDGADQATTIDMYGTSANNNVQNYPGA